MSLCIVDFATCFNLCYTVIHILGNIILRMCPFLESAIAWEVVSFRSPIVERLNTTKHHQCRLLSTSTDCSAHLASQISQSLSPALSLPNSQQGRTERAAPVGIRVHPAFSLMDNVGKLSWTQKNKIGKDGDIRDATRRDFSKAIFVNCKMYQNVILQLATC